MEPEFNTEEKKLYRAKTPKEYIEKSLTLDIPPGRKAYVTRYWLKKTGYTTEDIKHARNRHPYWKSKKMEGTAERNVARSIEHNYGDGSNLEWSKDMIVDFIRHNKKLKNGRYQYRDWELARHFKCTIPTIQHMRRKTNMAEKIISATLGNVTEKRLVTHLELGENTLRKMMKQARTRKK